MHITRTNSEIGDGPMRDTSMATGLGSKGEAVEFGLRSPHRLGEQKAIRSPYRNLCRLGDLHGMGTNR